MSKLRKDAGAYMQDSDGRNCCSSYLAARAAALEHLTRLSHVALMHGGHMASMRSKHNSKLRDLLQPVSAGHTIFHGTLDSKMCCPTPELSLFTQVANFTRWCHAQLSDCAASILQAPSLFLAHQPPKICSSEPQLPP